MSQTENNSLLLVPTTEYNCGLDHGTNEFAVVGDAWVVNTTGELPDRLLDTIIDLINNTFSSITNQNIDFGNNLLTAIENLNVAKNAYEQYIVDRQTDFDSLVASLTTLNATFNDNSATIVDLKLAYANAMGAIATTAQSLKAEFSEDIAAKLGVVYTTMANDRFAFAQALETMSAEMDSLDGKVSAVANSTFENSSKVERIANDQLYAINKFEYGSNITINGKTYNTGFGLVSTGQSVGDISTMTPGSTYQYKTLVKYGDKIYSAKYTTTVPSTITQAYIDSYWFYEGAGDKIYDSEFWIKADKFRITSASNVGVSPFTIDSSGNTPNITFTGNVVINNRDTALDGEAITKFWGSLSGAPTSSSVVIGDTYYNTNDNMLYTFSGTAWVGTARQTQVTGIAFYRGTSQPSTPSGGSYVSPTPTTSGWSDGIPSGTVGAVWWSSRVFTSDGAYPQDSGWSTPVQLTNTSDIRYIFSSSVSQPAAPGNGSSVPSGWSSTANTSTIWTAVSTMSNGVWSNYTVYKVKGEQGVAGTDGKPGSRGTAVLSGSATDSASMVAAFSSLGGPIYKDQYISSSATAGTYFYVYNGTSFVNDTALKVSGNAIIDGSLKVTGLMIYSGVSRSVYSYVTPGVAGTINDPYRYELPTVAAGVSDISWCSSYNIFKDAKMPGRYALVSAYSGTRGSRPTRLEGYQIAIKNSFGGPCSVTADFTAIFNTSPTPGSGTGSTGVPTDGYVCVAISYTDNSPVSEKFASDSDVLPMPSNSRLINYNTSSSSFATNDAVRAVASTQGLEAVPAGGTVYISILAAGTWAQTNPSTRKTWWSGASNGNITLTVV